MRSAAPAAARRHAPGGEIALLRSLPAATGQPTPRTTRLILGLTVALASGAAAIVLLAPAPPFRELNLLVRPFQILAPGVVGLIWWRRRPVSRIGPLLVALGWVSAVVPLQLTGVPALAILGLAAEVPSVAIQAYLVLSFPTGHLPPSRLARAAVALVALGLAGMTAIIAPFIPVVRPVDFLASCGDACVPNPLYVGATPEMDAVRRGLRSVVILVVSLLVTVPTVFVFADRWRRANHRQRSAILPLAATSLLLFPFRTINQVVLVFLGLELDAFVGATWLPLIGRVLFPLGFLLALVRAESLASHAVGSLVQRLSGDRSHASWAETIGRTLDDPSLRVGFWDAPTGIYREADGRPLEPPGGAAKERLWLEVARLDRTGEPAASRPLAAISADPGLAEDPELVEAAIAATRVAAESGELMDELRASRARLVTAADEERRRIGRDLHDSAQQRLVTAKLRLAAIGDPGKGSDHTLLAIREELDAALEELRRIARGLYPAPLARDGIAVALRSTTRSWLPRVIVEDVGVRRSSEAVEAAVYFACLEALQNAAKHAGPDVTVRVTLEEEGDALVFSVADDGRGFVASDGPDVGRDLDPDAEPDRDHPVQGLGLQTMRDRIAAIGGTLVVASRPGEGTTVTGRVPT